MFSESTGGKAEPENSAVDEKLIILQFNISSSESVYQIQLKSDGTGKIIYSDFPEDFEEFDHEIKVKKIAAEIDEEMKAELSELPEQKILEPEEIAEIRQEMTEERLTEVFWEQINPTLEDPFFRAFDDDLWGEEFRCEQGTVEELTAFLKLSLLTEKEIKEPDDYLILEAENEVDAAGLCDGSYYTERIAELVGIACAFFQPQGFSYDYNDGCYDRMSGYSHNSETIHIPLSEFARLPTREKMLGMKELRKQLTQMNVPPEQISKLTSF